MSIWTLGRYPDRKVALAVSVVALIGATTAYAKSFFAASARVQSNPPYMMYSAYGTSRSALDALEDWAPEDAFCHVGLHLVQSVIPDTVLVLRSDGAAEEAGVRAGDILREFNGKPIRYVSDFDSRGIKAGAKVRALIQGETGSREIELACADGLVTVREQREFWEGVNDGLSGIGAGRYWTRKDARQCVERVIPIIEGKTVFDADIAGIVGQMCFVEAEKWLRHDQAVSLANGAKHLANHGAELHSRSPQCHLYEYHGHLRATINAFSEGLSAGGFPGLADEIIGTIPPDWVGLASSEQKCSRIVDDLELATIDYRSRLAEEAASSENLVRILGSAIPADEDRNRVAEAEAMLRSGWELWDGENLPKLRPLALRLWRQAASSGNEDAEALVAQIDQKLEDEYGGETQSGQQDRARRTPAEAGETVLGSNGEEQRGHVGAGLPPPRVAEQSVAESPPVHSSSQPEIQAPEVDGEADEIFRLAESYLRGVGKPRNYLKAYALFIVAAGKGHTSASHSATQVEEKMPPEDIIRGQELAEELWEGGWKGLK